MRYLSTKDLKIENPFFKFKNFFKYAVKSCKESKYNFFIQCINCLLTFILISVIVQNLIDSYLDKIGIVTILGVYIPNLIITLIAGFVLFVVTVSNNIKWSSVFRTKKKHSHILLISLIVIYIICFYKTLLVLIKKIRDSLNPQNI